MPTTFLYVAWPSGKITNLISLPSHFIGKLRRILIRRFWIKNKLSRMAQLTKGKSSGGRSWSSKFFSTALLEYPGLFGAHQHVHALGEVLGLQHRCGKFRLQQIAVFALQFHLDQGAGRVDVQNTRRNVFAVAIRFTHNVEFMGPGVKLYRRASA